MTPSYNFRDNYKEDCKILMRDCFNVFDIDKDEHLNYEEFEAFLKCLFSHVPLVNAPDNNGGGTTGTRDAEDDAEEAADRDDRNSGTIVHEDFDESICKQILQYLDTDRILSAVKALLVVDVQNDFISGTLSVKQCPAGQDGADVVPVINDLIEFHKQSKLKKAEAGSFSAIVYSLDWHPSDHISFFENRMNRKLHSSSEIQDMRDVKLFDEVVYDTREAGIAQDSVAQKMWPAHCLQNTWGSQLSEHLTVVKDAVIVKKGMNPLLDSYSAFWDNSYACKTTMTSELVSRSISEVYVTGLAYDVCVGATALHALQHGYRTIVVEDACKGVTLEGIAAMRSSLIEAGAVVVHSDQAKKIMNREIIDPRLALKSAKNVRDAILFLSKSKEDDIDNQFTQKSPR